MWWDIKRPSSWLLTRHDDSEWRFALQSFQAAPLVVRCSACSDEFHLRSDVAANIVTCECLVHHLGKRNLRAGGARVARKGANCYEQQAHSSDEVVGT